MESVNKLKILFCVFPFTGHINPCIGIAEILYSRGHRIIFAVNNEWKNKLICYGFEEILIDINLPMDNDDFRNENVAFFKETVFNPKLSVKDKMQITLRNYYNFNFKGFTKIFSQLFEEIINSIQPNVIITDQFFTPAVPSVVKSGCPWVLFIIGNPLIGIDDDRTPPKFSGLPSYDTTEWSEFRDEYYRSLKPLSEEMNKWMIEEGLSPLPENRLRLESPFLNIYNYPKEMDYCDLRPLPSKWTQFDTIMRTENEQFVVPQHLSGKSGKLIYFTMGTMLSIHVETMERIINILAETPHNYIISKGPLANRYELPDNMYGNAMVPQTKVLPLVDMIIFHGGNNTLVESFYYGKPMIIMPLMNDAFDNAQRVVDMGFGLKLNPLTCTGDELINAIDKILNDKQLIERMKEISQRIQNESKSNKLAHAIEEIAE